MDVEALGQQVRRLRGTVLPFVGAGLALDAGAPSMQALAEDLARRFSVPNATGMSLGEVSKRIEKETGRLPLQAALAEIFSGLRLEPTPALTAISACPAQIVVTTNYDDAIEVAAEARGTTPVTLLSNDKRILEQPAVGTVHVVHVHGFRDEPESLVLPGRQMTELGESSVFSTFVRSMMIPRHVLYLGFGFRATEGHLRSIVGWLDAFIEEPRRHWMLIGASAARVRASDLELFDVMDLLEVVQFDDRVGYEPVEQVSLKLAPRSYDRETERKVDQRLTFVQPTMVRAQEGDSPEQLQQRIAGFDLDVAGAEALVALEALGCQSRTAIVASPGMGKSKLVEWLPYLTGQTAATGELRWFRLGEPPERSIFRLLRHGASGERLSVEEWDGETPLLVLLDGLDEVDAELQRAAVSAISAAGRTRPQHRYVVTTRPLAAALDLRRHGFDVVHIVPSRRWARKYLETRALPRRRVDAALQGEFGLDDLVSIPVFAELLADRLLDDADDAIEPLDLLVSSQLQAIKREALRSEVAAVPLEKWLRSLALGLQIRGKTSVPLAQLAGFSGTEPGIKEVHARLVRASVLGDVQDEAALPRQTMQEALVADAIIRAGDPLAALRFCAIAEIVGTERLRADFHFVADLVFEHATRDDRQRLKTLDEQRWARTVVTRGTLEDADEALRLIEQWHADRGIDFLPILQRPGLRSAERAVVAIGRRWPDLVLQLRDRLLGDVAQGTPDRRARALTLLGTLPRDESTATWLLPLLDDDDVNIAARAAAIAGRQAIRGAIPQLKGLLRARDERVRRTALGVLVELLPADRLSELAVPMVGSDPLRSVASRLAERLGLDTGLHLLGALKGQSPTGAWLLDRLVENFPPVAWTEERVRLLMRACDKSFGVGRPDFDALAEVVARHPAAALSEVRVYRRFDREHAWTGASNQLRLLLRLPEDALTESQVPEGLWDAMERERYWEADEASRSRRPEQLREQVITQIDAHGVRIDPESIVGHTLLRNLDSQRRGVLENVVAHRWSSSDLGQDEPRSMIAVAHIGAEIRAPLTPERWRELLTAHLNASRDFDLGDDRITAWLSETRPENETSALGLLVRSALDGAQIAKLLLIVGGEDEIALAAEARLRELDPTPPGWLRAAGILIASAGADRGLGLLSCVVGPARRSLMAHLASAGDGDAQAEVLRELSAQLSAGRKIERPHWQTVCEDAAVLDALIGMAGAAAAAGDSEALRYAVGTLTRFTRTEVVRHLQELVQRHPGLWWVGSAADEVAERCATDAILARLPRSVVEASAAASAQLSGSPR
jgi:hypothetical protein